MSKASKKQPEVIDFFCGAGGFSEGFRQQGFKVVMGVDNWRPAIESHNINHNLSDAPKDVLDFESLDEIAKLPDTEIIVAAPHACSSACLTALASGQVTRYSFD